MSDREIVSKRVVAFSREDVFDAWSDPARLARWWGPKDFTNTFYEFDLKPGGVWLFDMHGPNGATYPNRSVFVEIVPPSRIVLDHVVAPLFRIEASFDDHDGKTAITFRMIFEDAETCAKVKAYAVDKNEENFDRLEAELARTGAVAQ